jgi:hypothetical protein
MKTTFLTVILVLKFVSKSRGSSVRVYEENERAENDILT